MNRLWAMFFALIISLFIGRLKGNFTEFETLVSMILIYFYLRD